MSEEARKSLDSISKNRQLAIYSLDAGGEQFRRSGLEALSVDIARLITSVESVLRIHQPNGPYWPGGLAPGEYCKNDRKPYPCPTVIAIENALKP